MNRTAILRNDTIRWLVTILAIFLVQRALDSLSRPALVSAESQPVGDESTVPEDAAIDPDAQENWRAWLNVKRQR